MKMKWKTKKIMAMFLCILMVMNIVLPTLATVVTASDANAEQETEHIVLNTEPETSAEAGETTASETISEDPTQETEPTTAAPDPTETSEQDPTESSAQDATEPSKEDPTESSAQDATEPSEEEPSESSAQDATEPSESEKAETTEPETTTATSSGATLNSPKPIIATIYTEENGIYTKLASHSNAQPLNMFEYDGQTLYVLESERAQKLYFICEIIGNFMGVEFSHSDSEYVDVTSGGAFLGDNEAVVTLFANTPAGTEITLRAKNRWVGVDCEVKIEVLEELPEIIVDQVPECTCGTGGELKNHILECERRAYCDALINEADAEEIYNGWNNMGKDAQEYILSVLEEEEYLKYLDLKKRLDGITLTTREETYNGVAVSANGWIPNDVQMTIAEYDINENEKLSDYVALDEVLFALDISFTDNWQPIGEDKVAVTLDAAALGLEDGQEIALLHDHEGYISGLGVYVVENGALVFEMDRFSGVIAQPATEIEDVTSSDGKIYFDLDFGDVLFTDTSVDGWVSINKKRPEHHQFSHSATNEYYIYQSNGEVEDTSGKYEVPQYARVMEGTWGEFITNNTDVLEVIDEWNVEAKKVGRSETNSETKPNKNIEPNNPDVRVPMHHRIDITSAETAITVFDITLDNIWSGFQNDDCRDANGNFYMDPFIKDGPHYRRSGGLTFRPQNKETKAYIYLVGDNRFGNIHYDSEKDSNLSEFDAGGTVDGNGYCDVDEIDEKIEQMFFFDASQDGIPATLTVANLGGDNGYNHFCAVIGGANNPNYTPGLVFNGGTIYAGATVLDNCTAIGGGGCGFGGVTIKNGTITAVTATNGSAIGGGIGDGSNGGAAHVEILGGTVYAYNKGLAIEGTRESKGEDGTTNGQVIYAAMPAVAIGSGSSRRQWTVPARILITGGTVYAESVGGTAIGGGSSVNFQGADADITISNGANVTAKSVPGNVTVIHEYDNGIPPKYVQIDKTVSGVKNESTRTEFISASTSIGGGTAGVPFRVKNSNTLYPQGNGGTATLNISGKNTVVKAGSIGGGGANTLRDDPFPDSVTRPPNQKGQIGHAEVTISGVGTKTAEVDEPIGFVQGQVIMAAGAVEDCRLIITNSVIDNRGADGFYFVKENGGVAYVEDGTATITKSTIKGGGTSGSNIDGSENENVIQNGGAFFINGGSFSMISGKIQDCVATQDGGAVYVTASSGTLATVTIGDGNETNEIRIENNQAANGGGIYVDEGSSLTVQNGMIVRNKAEGIPQEVPATEKTAMGVRCGVGGGIYVADNSSFSLKGDKMGIYYNEASFAAKDVYASGEETTLDLPEVANMTLEGDAGIVCKGWFADYCASDIYYPTDLLGENNLGRYVFAMEGNVRVTKEDHLDKDKTAYYCLAVGTDHPGYGSLIIQKNLVDNEGKPQVATEKQTFLFQVRGTDTSNNNFKMDVILTIPAGQSSATVKIPHLVDGTYQVTEDTGWNWRYDYLGVSNDSNSTETNTIYVGIENNSAGTLPNWDISFRNKLAETRWSDGFAWCRNLFKKMPTSNTYEILQDGDYKLVNTQGTVTQ